ncbi:helix-turn-helix transcriptional regulator [Acidovorax sp. LjRoot74]|uniref:helix-turn-helix domain-containing protein n=1 Tax=Acidovorax sp. LjRoot74 TaxID=3342337 RepID=UPI003ECD1664
MKTIKAIRELLSMTQEELGKALGVSQGSVSAYESGVASIPVPNAIKLIEVAGGKGFPLSLDQIYGRAGIVTPTRKAKPTTQEVSHG